MRKLIIVLTLAASWLAVSTALNADPPPSCGPTCTVR